ncbi:MAG: HU family DNA-binding protein [Athalassotoga sp.]|uniref:HU family DNA-binding protein n=2 Tax=Athalassotoga sp. TaxID=2022597 RepID=UPI003D089D7D
MVYSFKSQIKGEDIMNKKGLVDEVAKYTGMTKKDVLEIIDAITRTIEKSVGKGDKVSLTGFGTFLSYERSGRIGRNPRTGKTIKIKAKKVPKFRAGKGLKVNL